MISFFWKLLFLIRAIVLFFLSNYKLHVLTSVLNRYKSRFDYYFLILELKTSIGGGGGNASCVMRVGFVRNANLYRCRFCLFSRRDISNNDVARNPCNLVNNTKKNFQSERNIHFFNLHLIIGLPFYSSLHDEHNCYPCKNCPFFLFFFFFSFCTTRSIHSRKKHSSKRVTVISR